MNKNLPRFTLSCLGRATGEEAAGGIGSFLGLPRDGATGRLGVAGTEAGAAAADAGVPVVMGTLTAGVELIGMHVFIPSSLCLSIS